jgi:hypothetical protein
MSEPSDPRNGIHFDDEGRAVWPESAEERERTASLLFGEAIMDAVGGVAREMSAYVGPEPRVLEPELWGKGTALEPLGTLSTEQRLAVGRLVRETARLTAYSMLLGWEHFPHGRVHVAIAPGTPDSSAQVRVEVAVVEWQQAFLTWEAQFAETEAPEGPRAAQQ